MSKFKKEFEFILSEQITYQYELGEKKTDSLTLKAPSNKHHVLLDKLRKELVKAMMNMANINRSDEDKKKKQEEKAELDGPALLFLLYGADFDLGVYKDIFWELMLDGLCLLDNKVKLTQAILDDIYYEDRTEILGEYTANFIVPSWMKRQLKK